MSSHSLDAKLRANMSSITEVLNNTGRPVTPNNNQTHSAESEALKELLCVLHQTRYTSSVYSILVTWLLYGLFDDRVHQFEEVEHAYPGTRHVIFQFYINR